MQRGNEGGGYFRLANERKPRKSPLGKKETAKQPTTENAVTTMPGTAISSANSACSASDCGPQTVAVTRDASLIKQEISIPKIELMDEYNGELSDGLFFTDVGVQEFI